MNLVRILSCLFLLLLCFAFPLHANDTAENGFRLVILGDSLTAGYGLPVNDSFPVQLEAALKDVGLDVRVTNAGVSGDTSAGGLSRVGWVLVDEPQLVIVELGGNDAMRGLDPNITRRNLDQLLVKLKQGGAQVILAGMQAPHNLGKTYVAEFNAIYPDLAKKHDIVLYPFFLEGVALDPELNQVDGIHPNAAGVRLIVKNILPLVKSKILSMQN